MEKQTRFSYIYISFYFILLGLIVFISGISGGIRFGVSICIYLLVFYSIYYIWKKFRKKEYVPIRDFFPLFLQKIASGICLIILIIGGFSIYHNIISPAKLPLFTLSNGVQTLKFQTMSHIASREFYEQVQASLKTSKQDEYVLYYEGVRPGTIENTAAFNTALGIDFNPEIYTNLSELYGIVAQNNNDFLGLINNKDYNIDISIDDIMEIYDGKTQKEKTGENKAIYDINSEIITQLTTLKPRELVILRFMNQSFLNFIMKNETFRNTIIEKVGNTDLFSVILDDRNTYIVDETLERNDEKVFLMYGLMHFAGIYELLKEQDSNWRIIDTESNQVIYPL